MNLDNVKQWIGNPVRTTVDKRDFPKGTVGILAGYTKSISSPVWSTGPKTTYHAVLWITNGAVFSLGIEFVNIVDGKDEKSDEAQDLLIAYIAAGSPKFGI